MKELCGMVREQEDKRANEIPPLSRELNHFRNFSEPDRTAMDVPYQNPSERRSP